MSVMRRWPIVLAWLLAVSSARAGMPAPDDPPAQQCRRAIRAAERASAIPGDLLAAIAHVESGRRDKATGAVDPWPWAINAEGAGYWYETKQAAVAAARAFQARGVRSIDVGCLQVNLSQHPDAFASLDQAFDPKANTDYAALFLTQLFDRAGAWPRAAAMYHSATPDVGAEYQTRVLSVWAGEKQAQAAALGPDGAAGQTLAAAGAAPGLSGGRVAVFLPPNRTEAMRIVPLGGTGASPDGGGRGLDSYRATPVALAARASRAGG